MPGYRVLDARDMSAPQGDRLVTNFRRPSLSRPIRSCHLRTLSTGGAMPWRSMRSMTTCQDDCMGLSGSWMLPTLSNMVPVAAWDLRRTRQSLGGSMPGVRFGGHQYREKLDGTLDLCNLVRWRSARSGSGETHIVPQEVAHYIPEPGEGGPAQSNDVDVDASRPDLPARPQQWGRHSGDEFMSDPDLLEPSVDPNQESAWRPPRQRAKRGLDPDCHDGARSYSS